MQNISFRKASIATSIYLCTTKDAIRYGNDINQGDIYPSVRLL